MDSDIEEQSVEIPKRRFIGQSGGALQDTSSLSMVSSTGSLTGTIFIRHRFSVSHMHLVPSWTKIGSFSTWVSSYLVTTFFQTTTTPIYLFHYTIDTFF